MKVLKIYPRKFLSQLKLIDLSCEERTILHSKFYADYEYTHCVKSVQIRSFFWFVFSRIRTEYGEILYLSVFSQNAGKYGPEKTLYLDNFHAVNIYLHTPDHEISQLLEYLLFLNNNGFKFIIIYSHFIFRKPV